MTSMGPTPLKLENPGRPSPVDQDLLVGMLAYTYGADRLSTLDPCPAGAGLHTLENVYPAND